MNGDALKFVEQFLNGEKTELPPKTTNAEKMMMIMFALRSVRTEFLDEIEGLKDKQEEIANSVGDINKLLFGERHDKTDGFLHRFLKTEEIVNDRERNIRWLERIVYGGIVSGIILFILSKLGLGV